MSDKPTWTTEQRKLGDLREWERNPRELSEHDAKHLARSIEKFNLADPLIINLDGQIIGGHQRKRVMLANGYGAADLIDVRVPSRQLTEQEAAELNIRLNRNAGAFDWDILANEFEIADLLDWGFSAFDLEMHDLAEEPEPADDPGAQLDKAAELQEIWQVERGQVWEAGSHRVMCGDSTCGEDVARLMAGEKAAMIMADPPYNVDYVGGSTNERERIDGDCPKWTDEEYSTWLQQALSCANTASDDRAALHLWFAANKMRSVMDAFEGAGWQLRNLLIWNKLKAHYGALGAQYKERKEPLWYCHKKGRSPRWFGPTNECTVWDEEQPHVNEWHPVMKPIALYERSIRNHTEGNDPVLECFLGSGTTIVACEQTGRRGFGMEICEKYVSVTLQRLADMGLEPRLAE